MPRYAEIIVWAIPIVGIIFGIQLLISELNRRTLYEDLMQTGVTTQAEIISHRTAEEKSTTYYVTYRFNGTAIDHTSQMYTKEEDVGHTSYDAIKDGDSVTIHYLPRDPNISYLEPLMEPSILGLLIPAFYFLGSPYILYFLIRLYRKRHKLENEGQVLPGELVECTGRKVKGKYQVTVKYCFATPIGEDKSASYSHEREDLVGASLPTSGTPVAVLYVDEKTFNIL
ncbi:MAG: DUF3592 domain-containing protein [Chloroflexota bacterium]